MYQETGFAKDPEDEQRCGTYGLFPLGEARFLLTARKSGFESGYDSKVSVQSYRIRSELMTPWVKLLWLGYFDRVRRPDGWSSGCRLTLVLCWFFFQVHFQGNKIGIGRLSFGVHYYHIHLFCYLYTGCGQHLRHWNIGMMSIAIPCMEEKFLSSFSLVARMSRFSILSLWWEVWQYIVLILKLTVVLIYSFTFW